MELTLEQRKQEYIELIREEYKPVKYKWWKDTRVHYHLTKDLWKDNHKTIDRVGPAEFKRGKVTGIVLAIIFGFMAVVFFQVGKVVFYISLITFIIICFAVLLPVLLDDKVRVRITRKGIWTQKLLKEIPWDDVLLIYIKEIENDGSTYYLIIHYYDHGLNEFLKMESSLSEISPFHISATIEFYRSEYIPTY